MRHTQIYRSGRGRNRRPRPVRIQALDSNSRNDRAALGCLLLSGAVLLGLCAAPTLFLVAVFLLDW